MLYKKCLKQFINNYIKALIGFCTNHSIFFSFIWQINTSYFTFGLDNNILKAYWGVGVRNTLTNYCWGFYLGIKIKLKKYNSDTLVSA